VTFVAARQDEDEEEEELVVVLELLVLLAAVHPVPNASNTLRAPLAKITLPTLIACRRVTDCLIPAPQFSICIHTLTRVIWLSAYLSTSQAGCWVHCPVGKRETVFLVPAASTTADHEADKGWVNPRKERRKRDVKPCSLDEDATWLARTEAFYSEFTADSHRDYAVQVTRVLSLV
jgi:hypothetical protein